MILPPAGSDSEADTRINPTSVGKLELREQVSALADGINPTSVGKLVATC